MEFNSPFVSIIIPCRNWGNIFGKSKELLEYTKTFNYDKIKENL